MITLQTLVEIRASADIGRAFVGEFGEDGSPTAREVFTALAKRNEAGWLGWLASYLEGFAVAIGNCDEGEFHSRVDGDAEFRAGFVIASGSSTVRAYDSSTVWASGSSTVRASGSSTVRAYDSSTVRAYGGSTVRAYGGSTVRAYDGSTVRAYGSSTVWAYDSSTVRAYGSSTVRAYDSSTVWASGSSTVRASGSSTVRAYDSSTVRAYDSSTVLLTRLSLRVSLKITMNACAVDRRAGDQPKLILADGDGEEA